MIRTAPIAFVLVAASCQSCDEDVLTSACTAAGPCWVVDGGSADLPGDNEGRCAVPGRWACVDGGAVCLDPGEPIAERCNGIDDDCDGFVDNIPPGEPTECVLLGRCNPGIVACRDGEEVCKSTSYAMAEQCNGIDDDCDGLTDEDFSSATVFYYDEGSHPLTVNVGECRPGSRRCDGVLGMTEVDPVYPIEEVCGDGRDNDCDGVTDEAEGVEDRAFVLVVDYSGSMETYLTALSLAICSWSSDPGFAGSRFAVVGVDVELATPHIALLQDFATAADTCITLGNAGPFVQSGLEYMMSGIIAEGALSWPEEIDGGDRYVFAFTDEQIQIAPGSAQVGEDELGVMVSCQARPFRVGVFTSAQYVNTWDGIVDQCGGFVDTLETNTSVMEQKLNAHFAGLC